MKTCVMQDGEESESADVAAAAEHSSTSRVHLSNNEWVVVLCTALMG